MKKNTLKRNMMLSFLLVAMIPTMIAMSYYFIAQQTALRQRLKEEGERDLTHTIRQLEMQADQVSEFVSWALHSDDILSLLERSEADANAYDAQYHRVISQIGDQLSYRPVSQYLRACFLLGENGLDIRSGSEASLTSEQTIEQLQEAQYDATYWGTEMENTTPFTLPGRIIPYCHPIQNTDGKQIGILLLLFSDDVFRDCYDGLLQDTENRVQLYNGRDALLCGLGETELETSIEVTKASHVNNWYIVLSMTESMLQKQYHMLMIAICLFGGLMLLIAVLISWMLTRTLISPIERILDRVHRISQGRFESTVRREEKNEIDYLENSILDMQDNIVLLMEQERQKELDKQQLEIRVLQEQMNPHFLYHTLNTIRLMATMQGKQSIAKMTETLITLLRANLSVQEATVSVSQELDLLESYMYIQNISQKGRLQWDWSGVPEEVRTQMLPKLLLQPLAENAIIHGFSNLTDMGMITVTGSRQGSRMILCMTDNGSGIPEDRLKEIRYALHHPDEMPRRKQANSHGIALVNVQKRIWLHYGEQYGLTIDSEEGHGCRVTVRLPFEDRRNTQ